VGTISFPLYLWHWPIISFATIVNDELPSRAGRAAAMIVTIPLAWMTCACLERPARFGAHRDALVAAIFFLVIATGAAGLALPAVLRPTLAPSQAALLTQLSKVGDLKSDMGAMYGEKSCMRYAREQTVEMFVRNGCVNVSRPELPTVFLIGDSHSGSLAIGLRPLMEARNVNLIQVSTAWCEPTSNDKTDVACQAINRMVYDQIGVTRPDLLIINSNWLGASAAPYYVGDVNYMDHLSSYLARVIEKGAKKVVVVGQVPTWKASLPALLIRRYVMAGRPIPARTYEGVQAESLEMDSRMKAVKFPEGVTYLSVRDALCDQAGCLTAVGPNPESDLVVWDYGHFTRRGAEFVSKRLFDGLVFAESATSR
jgi:hypothetical protein